MADLTKMQLGALVQRVRACSGTGICIIDATELIELLRHYPAQPQASSISPTELPAIVQEVLALLLPNCPKAIDLRAVLVPVVIASLEQVRATPIDVEDLLFSVAAIVDGRR